MPMAFIWALRAFGNRPCPLSGIKRIILIWDSFHKMRLSARLLSNWILNPDLVVVFQVICQLGTQPTIHGCWPSSLLARDWHQAPRLLFLCGGVKEPCSRGQHNHLCAGSEMKNLVKDLNEYWGSMFSCLKTRDDDNSLEKRPPW